MLSMSHPLIPAFQERIVFDNLLNGIYFVDRNGKITYWNKAAESISGFAADEVLGKSCRDDILVHALGNDILCNEHCPLKSVMKSFDPITATVSLRHKDGYRVPVRVRCVPLLDADNQIIGAAEIFERVYVQEDITLKLKELGQFAYIDALTEIPNRRYMEEALQDWLQAHYGRNWPFAVAMGDIDFFKKVNDEHGHDAGDLVLKKIAEVLRKNLRSMDIVGRWGGEEFLLLLQNIPFENLHEKLESLRKAIENSWVENDGIRIKVTMSFGCTVPCKDDSTLSLVARADELLYKSKREGRNKVSMDEEI